MTQVAGTTDTFDLVGIAEDIEDTIYDISPTETPLFSMAEKIKATNTYHLWQTDALAAASLNAQIEGDDASYVTAAPTVLLGNYTQIFRKTLIVSETADAVRKYGRSEESTRLATKYGKEWKRDVEYSLVRNSAASAGGSQTARLSAGIESMIAGNRVLQTGNTTGTVPGFASAAWTAPTDGTTGTLDETLFISALDAAWTDGGDPSKILVNSLLKRKFAGFGGATKFAGTYVPNAGKVQSMVVGGVDYYVSDFGTHSVMLNRYMRRSVVLCLDPDYVAVATLRPFKATPLAKTGDANKLMMRGELCLVVKNPDAHAQVRDVN